MIVFKALSKAEFAEDAGISASILREWTKKWAKELAEFGVTEKSKLLPPAAVRFLAEKYQVVTRNARVI